jgi:hypothetical protein
MRVSDADREAAAAELQEHFASGRLNQDELDERLAAAFAAKTRGDLDAVFADLPSSGGAASGNWASGGAWSAGAHSGAQGHGNAQRVTVGRGIGRLVAASVLVWLLLIVGILGVFGIGTGRPVGIVLLVAAFALLRRLLFMIFGRRMRRGRGRGPRRRR